MVFGKAVEKVWISAVSCKCPRGSLWFFAFLWLIFSILHRIGFKRAGGRVEQSREGFRIFVESKKSARSVGREGQLKWCFRCVGMLTDLRCLKFK